jgi:hypothetical protein
MREFFAPRPWKRSLAWLCFLGPFFFLTYGFANHHTASLGNVGSCVFAWETHIPFWPWTIVPYWTIDAFYGLSLFLFTDKREMDRHAARLIMATAVCVTGFLLFPLRFSFEKPAIAQPVFRWMFDVLGLFDMPYNQAPSLHLCLLVLLWAAYKRHAPPGWKRLVHIWALVIGVSVFTTYQHHIIDGITGIPAGIFCCYCIPLVPGRSWTAPLPGKAHRLAIRYGVGGLILAGLALALQGWWLLLLWPALSLFVLVRGYMHAGPSIFRKSEGASPNAGKRCTDSRIILAPYELATRLVRYLFYKSPPAAEIIPGLWLGGFPKKLPIETSGVIDLAAEYPRNAVSRGMRYASVPMMDLLPPTLEEAEHAVKAYLEFKAHGPVLLHCALGMTRSAAVAAWILVREHQCAGMEEALEHIRALRPGMALSPEAVGYVTHYGDNASGTGRTN